MAGFVVSGSCPLFQHPLHHHGNSIYLDTSSSTHLLIARNVEMTQSMSFAIELPLASVVFDFLFPPYCSEG
ncbi:MAG: hypothetical protein ACRCZK_01100 [Oscillospiraceae bacterium]